MNKPKFQFNLKTTLLLMTIAALAIFSYSQSVRIRELQDDLNIFQELPRHDDGRVFDLLDDIGSGPPRRPTNDPSQVH